jgi:uncharacterized membrane protein YjgN (DUF898 family)
MIQEEGLPTAGDNSVDKGTQPQLSTLIYPLKFLGTGKEYFRIWIVNLFLTVITLGIYAAWAKVRTRQYFYANTYLAGHQFEYLANPVGILKGNLIMAGAFMIYSLTNHLAPRYGFLVVLIFFPFLPFLIYQALRFYLHNSAYRDIRFRFLGTLSESYKTYLLLPALMPFTLGLVYPYWAFRKKKYFLNNAAYGTTCTTFNGISKPFYSSYLNAGLMGVCSFFIFIAVGVVAVRLFDPSKGKPFTHPPQTFFIIITLIMMIAIFFFMNLILQYIYARLTNYSLNNTRLGNIRFKSSIETKDLLWIQVTNMAAIVLSLGLLIPWAKIRRARYILDNLIVLVTGSLDEFTAAMDADESALGDSATGFFDMEIGL